MNPVTSGCLLLYESYRQHYTLTRGRIVDSADRRRPERNDLTGEHRLGDAGQLVLAIVFGAVWAVDSFVLGWTTFLNEIVPGWLRTSVGLIFVAVAGVLAFTSIRDVFGVKRDPPSVIRTGLYGIVRHPMYLSEVVLYLGLLFLSISLAAFVVWIAVIVFLRFLCVHEEKLLIDRFGDDYRDYMRVVPMWIPRTRRRG
jgi:protein-S-isoprenylcysteine O-methyltransferase Ste14